MNNKMDLRIKCDKCLGFYQPGLMYKIEVAKIGLTPDNHIVTSDNSTAVYLCKKCAEYINDINHQRAISELHRPSTTPNGIEISI